MYQFTRKKTLLAAFVILGAAPMAPANADDPNKCGAMRKVLSATRDNSGILHESQGHAFRLDDRDAQHNDDCLSIDKGTVNNHDLETDGCDTGGN